MNGLQEIGRGPEVVRVGRRVLITDEAKTAWLQDMARNPLSRGVRPEKERLRAERASRQQAA